MTALRTADAGELQTVLDWAADEGWKPGLDDAAAFLPADPEGFFVATDGDTPVAAISVVNHSDDFAFLGLYIVRPDYRGRGLGLRLWAHALAHAGHRTVGLDGVPDQQGNYARSGFVHAGATVRWSGGIAPRTDARLRLATKDDIHWLVDEEGSASGYPKPIYLGQWFRNTQTRQTLILNGYGAKPGFCTVRKCRDGAKVGPLLAHAPQDAVALLHGAAAVFESDLMIDVPETSRELSRICESAGMTPGFRTARMYRGPFRTSAHPLFAVATLELG